MRAAILHQFHVNPLAHQLEPACHQRGAHPQPLRLVGHHQAPELPHQVGVAPDREDDGRRAQDPAIGAVLRHHCEYVVVVEGVLQPLIVQKRFIGVVVFVVVNEEISDEGDVPFARQTSQDGRSQSLRRWRG